MNGSQFKRNLIQFSTSRHPPMSRLRENNGWRQIDAVNKHSYHILMPASITIFCAL